MGLQLRRRSSASVYIIGILVGVAAFVSQPLYNLVSSQVANAATVSLSTPQLLSPTDNAIVNGTTITSEWQSVTDATNYIYESYNDAAATSMRHTATYATTSTTETNVTDGTVFWWRVKAVATSGAESDWSPLWKVTVDNSAPVVTMSGDKPVVGSTFNLSATATDVSGVGGCQYQIFDSTGAVVLPADGSKVSFACDGSVTPVDVSGFASGDYTVKIWSVDMLGNASVQNAAQQTFTVDHIAPVATVAIMSTANPMASTDIKLAGTVDNSDLQSFKLYVDGVEAADLIKNIDSVGSWAYTLSGGLAQGSHTLLVVAIDSHGNASTKISSPDSFVSVSVSAYIPPVGSGNVAPLTLTQTLPQLVAPPQTVTIVPAVPITPAGQNDQAVLGAKTSKDDSNANVAATPSVVAPSETGWKLLGIAWYWWLLALAIGVGSMWTTSALKSRRQTA